jgi:hypothetical protein
VPGNSDLTYATLGTAWGIAKPVANFRPNLGTAPGFNQNSGGSISPLANSDLGVPAKDIPFTFRGDSRAPNEIFPTGFQPKGTNTDLYDYARNNSPSIYVGTSRSPNRAADFATDYGSREGFVYTVRPRNGIDVNQTLGSRSPFPYEQEIVVPGGISPSDIRGVTPVSKSGDFLGYSTINPNFVP